MGRFPAGPADDRALRRVREKDRVGVVHMHEYLPLHRERLEGCHAAFRARDADMTHALAGLLTDAGDDHFVIAPKRAIEQHQGRSLEPPGEIIRHAGASRHIEEVRRTVARHDFEADRIPDLGTEICACRSIFQIERNLSGYGKSLYHKPRWLIPSRLYLAVYSQLQIALLNQIR